VHTQDGQAVREWLREQADGRRYHRARLHCCAYHDDPTTGVLGAEIPPMLRCAAPHCGRARSVTADWTQLDLPGRAVLLFCGLRCLYVWVRQEMGA